MRGIKLKENREKTDFEGMFPWFLCKGTEVGVRINTKFTD